MIAHTFLLHVDIVVITVIITVVLLLSIQFCVLTQKHVRRAAYFFLFPRVVIRFLTNSSKKRTRE